jgi:acylphosphatase
MATAVTVKVTGRVQGVAFRWYTLQEAERLGVKGWVRNEPDGSVLAHYEGEDDAVEEMLTWCREGSPSATVHHVEVRDVEPTRHGSFEVRY